MQKPPEQTTDLTLRELVGALALAATIATAFSIFFFYIGFPMLIAALPYVRKIYE